MSCNREPLPIKLRLKSPEIKTIDFFLLNDCSLFVSHGYFCSSYVLGKTTFIAVQDISM